ncbi:RDD family protein [Actinomadura roseirufa]|uniref:RDD family protein n=1 Tax=Actinomadura roseirufa TaxID=2094049 RepID=UPI0010415B10|nr:RDD family protein [Actinomadura roseirufa]
MAELVTGEAVALDIRVARLASRGCALLLDLLLQVVILNIALYVTAMTTLVADEAWAAGLSVLAMVAVIVGYPCAFETLSRGRTLGKMAVGLRVVGDDGGPIRFRQALVRALAGFIEFWTFFSAPALVASFCSGRGKRLGDLFAGTIVIQERVPTSVFGPVAVMPPHLAGWARTLELSMLSDELAMTARQYLSRFWELLPEVRDSLGQRITDQVVAAVSPPPPPGVRPEILLSAVLAERRHREEWRLAQRRAARLRRAGRPAEPQPGPVPVMAGAPLGHPVRQGPPAPPPFSTPGPGQPRFLPPQNYGAGPYQGMFPNPQAGAPGPRPVPYPRGPYPAGPSAPPGPPDGS